MHAFFLLVIIILILCIRGRITNAIPADIIQNICEELDHVVLEKAQPEISTLSSIALQKHLKNCDVLAVSHVCKSWRSHTAAFICLWRDIAFDVSDPKSIRLAATLLSLVESEDVLLRIYAGFGPNGLPDPNILNLLSDLRRHTHRWTVFEYQGALGEYHPYLDLPAPNLHTFSDRCDSSQGFRQLFAGRTPSLRYLLTSSTSGWDSTTLPNLTEFHFGRSSPGPPLSLNSLIDLLRSTPELGALRLEWLGSFVHDCTANATVCLPRLHTLRAYNTDFDTLAERIRTPNVRNITFTIDTPTHPSFHAPHALTRLPQIPILTRPISEVTVVIAARPTQEGTFCIHLAVPGGSSFDICLIWDTGIMQHWKSYTTETLSVLTQLIRLDPSAILRLYLGVGPTRRSQGALKIQGGFARSFFRLLASAETPPAIPSPFAYRLLIANDAPFLDEDETQMFRLFLQSRATCEAGLSVRLRHGTSPWLCAEDFECPDECKCIRRISIPPSLILVVGCDPHQFLEFEFYPLEDE